MNTRALFDKICAIADSGSAHSNEISMLIENPNFADEEGYTLAHWAAQENRVDVLNYLFKYNQINLNAKIKKNQYTPLYLAIKNGNLDAVKALLNHDKTLFSRELSHAPLQIAVAHGKVDIVEFLLKEGADVTNVIPFLTAIDGQLRGIKEQESPDTVKQKSLDIVRLFLRYGANVNYINDPKTGNGILHRAVRAGNIEMVKLLLESGADINLQNKEKKTALHHAFLTGQNDEMINLLLDHGADPHIPDNTGWTALTWAEHNKRKDISEKMHRIKDTHITEYASDEAYNLTDLPREYNKQIIIIYSNTKGRHVFADKWEKNKKGSPLHYYWPQ